MKGYKHDDPEGQALEDLLNAMSAMRQKRIPRPEGAAPVKVDIPPGVLPPEGPGRDLGAGGGEIELPAGMDPRLADIIRKKKTGAAA